MLDIYDHDLDSLWRLLTPDLLSVHVLPTLAPTVRKPVCTWAGPSSAEPLLGGYRARASHVLKPGSSWTDGLRVHALIAWPRPQRADAIGCLRAIVSFSTAGRLECIPTLALL